MSEDQRNLRGNPRLDCLAMCDYPALSWLIVARERCCRDLKTSTVPNIAQIRDILPEEAVAVVALSGPKEEAG